MTDTPAAIDVDNLPPTQNLMLELLAARYRLGHTQWAFPKGQRHIAEQLTRLGLVWWESDIAAKTIRVKFTDAGKAVMLSHPYTPPILRRTEPQQQPLDLRALAVILARGQDAARDIQDPGLAQALWFMAEQAVALADGPQGIIGNLDEEFARVKASYE